jgi:hypothetical protein
LPASLVRCREAPMPDDETDLFFLPHEGMLPGRPIAANNFDSSQADKGFASAKSKVRLFCWLILSSTTPTSES